jgi:uncharacterized protein (DUF58 family)
MIFDEPTLRKLKRLTLLASQVRAGTMKGERRSTRRGASIEFADYRDYTPGDDLRRLDWNIYARLGRPFVKLFEDEEDLAVHVLVDASKSMDWGEGEANKFQYAARLAGALGAIALSKGDLFSAAFLQSGRQAAGFGPTRGQASLVRYLAFLEGLKPAGSTDLNSALRSYAHGARRPGLAILISDMFTPGGYTEGLTWLQSQGYEIVLVHILSPEEADPPLAGDLHLVDVETGATQEVSLDGGVRELYRRRLRAWQDEMRAFCARRSIRSLSFTTAVPWEKVILYDLRKTAVVK